MNNSSQNRLVRKRLSLEELLQFALPDELVAIVDTILNYERDKFFRENDLRHTLLKYRDHGGLNQVTDLIAREIRFFGSNTIGSVLRNGEPVSYEEVVRDVAKECKIKFSDKADVADIEKEILLVQIKKLFHERNKKEIEDLLVLGGISLSSAAIDAIVNEKHAANFADFISNYPELFQLPTLMIGRAMHSMRGIDLVLMMGGANPVLSAISKAKAAYEKNSPSLSVILSAVIRVAAVRQRLIAADLNKFFMELRECL